MPSKCLPHETSLLNCDTVCGPGSDRKGGYNSEPAAMMNISDKMDGLIFWIHVFIPVSPESALFYNQEALSRKNAAVGGALCPQADTTGEAHALMQRLPGFSTWILGDFQSLSWSKTEGVLHLKNLRWAKTDGLPFRASGSLGQHFCVKVPQEESGVWLHAHGTPFQFCAAKVQSLQAPPLWLPMLA